jgi:hypothetical protein
MVPTLVVKQEVSMETLKRIDNAGETLIEAVRTVGGWVASLAETVGPPIVRRIPTLPVPEALQPPRPREIVASTFKFWEGFAQAQNEFTLRMLDAFDPATQHSKAARHAKSA